MVGNFKDEKIWRSINNIWTVVFMLFVIVNFFARNRYEDYIAPFSVIYIGVLGLYAGTKEFDRWYEIREGRHPGELFVIAWTVIVFSLLILGFFLGEGYKLSSEAVAAYIMVLSVFALTQKSKQLHKRRRAKK